MTRASIPVVVKIGGRALEARGALAELAADLARLSAPAILVHGGGAEVSAWCARLGIEIHQVDGLRVTDADTLEVVTAVLAGLANKRLVASLRAAGLDAVGLAALDGGLLECVPHPRVALGRVGAPLAVRTGFLDRLLEAAQLPVIASIGAYRGELLNFNADDVAMAIAAATGARDLVMLSDAPGLRLGGHLVARLEADDLAAALEHPEVGGGMVAKLRAIATALERGVSCVHLGAWSGPGTLARALSDDWEGTRIDAALAFRSREAR